MSGQSGRKAFYDIQCGECGEMFEGDGRNVSGAPRRSYCPACSWQRFRCAICETDFTPTTRQREKRWQRPWEGDRFYCSTSCRDVSRVAYTALYWLTGKLAWGSHLQRTASVEAIRGHKCWGPEHGQWRGGANTNAMREAAALRRKITTILEQRGLQP